MAFDGVVLNDAASDGVDLALLPPALVERADVYRGFVPVRLGVSGLGGGLELTTRQPDEGARAWAGFGYGSFGTRRATLFASARARSYEGLVALGYRGTDGDFTFLNDGATPRLPQVETRRQNAAADALDLLARACAIRSDGSRGLCLVALSGWRDREVPGPGASQALGPYATQRRTLARLSAPFSVGPARFETWAAVIARDDAFWNTGAVTLYGDGPYVTRSHSTSLEAGVSARVRSSWFTLDPVLRVRRESFEGQRLTVGSIDASRTSALVGYEAEARFERLRVTHGAGVEVLSDRAPDGGGVRAPFTARLGVSWAPTRWFELRANGGHARRAPTLPELYGDRGFIRGEPTLRPESAFTVDLGAVLSTSRRRWRARVELAGYLRATDDMIVLVQVNRSFFRPANLGFTRVAGLEAHARLAWSRALTLTASYALVDARVVNTGSALDGNRVPGVPMHDVYVSLDGFANPRRIGALRAGVSLSYVSDAFLEESNTPTARILSRALVGATASWSPSFIPGLTLSVAATNLLDLRSAIGERPDGSEGRVAIQDYFGYPLPGRSVFASFSLTTAPDTP